MNIIHVHVHVYINCVYLYGVFENVYTFFKYMDYIANLISILFFKNTVNQTLDILYILCNNICHKNYKYQSKI